MAGRTSYWITVQYPYKPPRIEVRGINSGEKAIALAKELHHTRPTATIEVLKVQRVAQVHRSYTTRR